MPLITVNGIVNSVQDGQYPNVKVWETFNVNGVDRYRLWTAWTDVRLDVQEGDTISITGDMGTKVGTYTKPGDEPKAVVEHSLNNTTLDAHSAKVTTEAPKQATTTASAYNAPSDDSAPF